MKNSVFDPDSRFFRFFQDRSKRGPESPKNGLVFGFWDCCTVTLLMKGLSKGVKKWRFFGFIIF